MKHILFATVALLGLLETAAVAKGYQACKDLQSGDTKACTAAADARCGTLEYWPSQRCAEEVAQEFDMCVKDGAFERERVKAEALKNEFCQVKELDVHKADGLKDFKRRALGLPAIVTSMKQFESKWQGCGVASSPMRGAPILPVTYAKKCIRANNAVTSDLKASIDFSLGKPLAQNIAHHESAMAKGDYAFAQGPLQSSLDLLLVFQDLNKALPNIAYKQAAIATAITGLNKRSAEVARHREKTLAKVRCPAGKANNKSVIKKLRPAVSGFFHSTPGTTVDLKIFRLAGKKSKTRNAARRETTESYPGFACTKKVKVDATFCQVFNISVKRSKVDRKPWGAWKTYVGSSQRMACKNLK